MQTLPGYISILFAFTTFVTVFLFYKAANNSKPTIIILAAWLLLQTIISMQGFYKVTNTTPPRFAFLILPPLLFIIILFSTAKGRHYIDKLNAKTLTILHTVRIAVELILFCLFINKTIPLLMTFEGRNFDLLSGITAPFIYYFGFTKKKISARVILLWNIICLGLLLNIIVNAILSAPFKFQQFGFDQPNIAILHFPFVWLPGCIVPLVLLSHLVVIRQLTKRNNKE
jgi:hypothetical protein